MRNESDLVLPPPSTPSLHCMCVCGKERGVSEGSGVCVCEAVGRGERGGGGWQWGILREKEHSKQGSKCFNLPPLKARSKSKGSKVAKKVHTLVKYHF